MTATAPAASRQYPLDLGHRTAMGRQDFLVTEANRDAVRWLDLWPDWPAPALILYGPPACGKTHLAAVWAAQSGAARLTPAHVPADLPESGHLILDEADALIGARESEEALFHLYNRFKEEGRSLLLLLNDPPIRRDFVLPDLASRLRAAPCVSVLEPDDTLLAAVMVKLFADRQLKVGEEVIAYILPRLERSFAAVRD